MRLIDADALEKSICQNKCEAEECGMTFERDGAEYCLEVQMVKDAPTIDAVQVVRCKDCRYGYCDKQFYFNDSYRCNIHDDGFETHNADWYCPDGKRKDEE